MLDHVGLEFPEAEKIGDLLRQIGGGGDDSRQHAMRFVRELEVPDRSLTLRPEATAPICRA